MEWSNQYPNVSPVECVQEAEACRATGRSVSDRRSGLSPPETCAHQVTTGDGFCRVCLQDKDFTYNPSSDKSWDFFK